MAHNGIKGCCLCDGDGAQVLEEKDAEVVCVDSDDEDGGGMGKLVEGIDDEDEEESEIDLSRTSSADGGEEDEEDEEEGNFVWDVHTALLDVKKSAVFCLGEVGTCIKFMPFSHRGIVQVIGLYVHTNICITSHAVPCPLPNSSCPSCSSLNIPAHILHPSWRLLWRCSVNNLRV